MTGPEHDTHGRQLSAHSGAVVAATRKSALAVRGHVTSARRGAAAVPPFDSALTSVDGLGWFGAVKVPMVSACRGLR